MGGGGGQNCYVVWNWSSASNIGLELYAVHRENIINKTGHSLLESFSESCIGVSHSTQHFIKIVTKLSQRSPDDIHVLRREKNKLVSFLVQIKKRFPSPFHGASRAVSKGPVYFIRERELEGAINLSSCWRAGQTIYALSNYPQHKGGVSRILKDDRTGNRGLMLVYGIKGQIPKVWFRHEYILHANQTKKV